MSQDTIMLIPALVRRSILLLLALLFVQEGAASGDASKILDCMANNMPQTAGFQDIEFRSRSLSADLFEDERILRASVYLGGVSGNRRNILAYFHEPFEVRGARILLLEKESGNETYLYAPVFGDVRRLTGRHVSSSVNGTDFSYEDLEQLYGVAKGGHWTQLDTMELDGRDIYVLESVNNAGGDVTYPRIKMYVDKSTCVTIKMKLYGNGERVRKIFSVDTDSVRRINDSWIPYKMTMRDKRNMTETRLVVHETEFDTSLPDGTFDPGHLKSFKPQ